MERPGPLDTPRIGAAGRLAVLGLCVLLAGCALPPTDKSGPPANLLEGELAAGDKTLSSGEYADEYLVEGVPGQSLTLALSSPDFDSYLVLVDPEGQQIENDDHEGSGDSFIQTRLQVPGVHRVLVTSYEPGEVGRYGLTMELGEVRPVAEVAEIQVGESRDGHLGPEDEVLDQGELVDRYTFWGEAGTPLDVRLTSTDLDTYLVLLFPDGAALENDDDWDEAQRSRLELTLPQTGSYELWATSYGAGEQGVYRLDLQRAEASAVPQVRGAPGRTLALLVGISDYGGRATPLENTAEDAANLQRVLLERTDTAQEDTVLLLDDEATVERFRSALGELTRRMSATDQLVLFYSGHGGRVRRGSFQPADPDSVDETLNLYDGDVTDDELAGLLDGVPGRILLVLDSCFSGGFAKDVISAPGRMGLFSSEEDVTSSVADKFRAGGYLAVFLTEALAGEWADDGDRMLTTLELSHYLHERYRTDVKGGGPDDFVRTDLLLGYQRLVVDRGSLGPADVLFRLQ